MTNRDAIAILENLDSYSIFYGDGAAAVEHAVRVLYAAEELARVVRERDRRPEHRRGKLNDEQEMV